MPFKIVESATCDVCGDVFKGKNPSYALWVHQQKSKVPCSLKRDLKEMNAFKSNLTLEVFREHKRLKTQASESIQLKKNMERIEVEVGRHSAIPGVPAAGSFPMSRREGRRPRQQWHVRVAFEQPVRGPIVLGAGRYRGHGLMMPIHETSGADH